MGKPISISITIVCILVFLISWSTIGCSSKELNRGEAKKLLSKVVGDEIGDLDSGFVVAGGIPSFGAFTGTEKQITPAVYRLMEKKGLVKLQELGLVMLGERFFVTFPDDIRKKYVLSTESKETVQMDGRTYTKDISKVLLGKSSIKEITGIRQEGKDVGAKAKVEFIIHMEVTPFGELMLPDYLKGPDIAFIANVERYDDGWRIVNGSLMPVQLAKSMGIN